jgi:hypothetical protein
VIVPRILLRQRGAVGVDGNRMSTMEGQRRIEVERASSLILNARRIWLGAVDAWEVQNW